MSSVIKLVRNDNRPFITLALTDQTTGAAIDVSGATVRVYFRAAGATPPTILATLVCTNVTTGVDGRVKFNFPTNTLDVAAGSYEGEIEISFGASDVQTVYELLKFKVREDFT